MSAPGLAATLSDRLGEYGAAKIYAAESDELGDYLVTPKVTVLEQLARSGRSGRDRHSVHSGG